jgi:hypothetical protein
MTQRSPDGHTKIGEKVTNFKDNKDEAYLQLSESAF